jgi:hypothetical protein
VLEMRVVGSKGHLERRWNKVAAVGVLSRGCLSFGMRVVPLFLEPHALIAYAWDTAASRRTARAAAIRTMLGCDAAGAKRDEHGDTRRQRSAADYTLPSRMGVLVGAVRYRRGLHDGAAQ